RTATRSDIVRAIGPPTSRVESRGAMPYLLTNAKVERMPKRFWKDDGPRIELPVSEPRPTVPKLAATAAAVPPLEPAVTRFVSYGLCVVPRMEFTVSSGLKANSPMFDLARTMAPAALMRLT